MSPSISKKEAEQAIGDSIIHCFQTCGPVAQLLAILPVWLCMAWCIRTPLLAKVTRGTEQLTDVHHLWILCPSQNYNRLPFIRTAAWPKATGSQHFEGIRQVPMLSLLLRNKSLLPLLVHGSVKQQVRYISEKDNHRTCREGDVFGCLLNSQCHTRNSQRSVYNHAASQTPECSGGGGGRTVLAWDKPAVCLYFHIWKTEIIIFISWDDGEN